MFDITKMLGKIKEAQSKMQQVQNNLAKFVATAESGAGMVKATVDGKKQVVNLEIDDTLLNPKDKDMLRDLVIAAINKAMDNVSVQIKEEIKKQTEGSVPNIPGVDLSSFFNNG